MEDKDKSVVFPQADPTLSKRQPNNLTFKLINEIKKRPLLWDRKHEYYNCRSAIDREWGILSVMLYEHKEFLKNKWKNLRDQFQKELKKVITPVDDTEESYKANYGGKWAYFEILLFLKDTMKLKKPTTNYHTLEETEAQNKDPLMGEVPQEGEEEPIAEDDIKRELIVFEEETNSDNYDSETPNSLQSRVYGAPPQANTEEKNEDTCSEGNGYQEECGQKRKGSFALEETQKKKKYRKLSPADSDEFDDDVHFVKSLVPFLRNLNPVRKLLVRNEIQNILLREHLCDRCNGNRCDK